ncbi:MAG: class II fumarate hydratase [Acidobacteriota bacterium]
MDNHEDEAVDLATEQSFPASDPPPWTLGVRPPAALYGPQTRLAVKNFPDTGHRLQPQFIRALGLVKSCAARANATLGVLSFTTACAIEEAADRIAAGELYAEFPVSVFQTGSGTSTNMNANEVIATLAGVHPNDDANRSQSSNDVIPAAIHIAAAAGIHHDLLPALDALLAALEGKAQSFVSVAKIGRTHLQDATPMTLGQEFGAFAHQVRASAERISQALQGIYELPLGGTAVGSGINAPHGYAKEVTTLIAQRTGLPFREARNHFEAQASKDAVHFLSGALKSYAVALTKIANDIRWLASGPRAGLNEITLPELQPGSSIMPGKVNPVIPESVLMICAQVIGHDAAITWACASGNFQLNTMMPLIAYDLLDAITLLTAATSNFAALCIDGIEANSSRLKDSIERSLALATALTPAIGYDHAARIAKEAAATNRTIREVALESSGLTAERIDELLSA